ncbi:MAG: Ig-like domain-containing protein [Proteiniphilum sp.]|nr:Ig-like domain-containing protein [Proteiniphilum sp.]
MKKYFLLVPILTILFSCSKEEAKPALSIKNNELTLFRESTEELIVENNSSDVSFKSENNLIASVSEEGIVEGRVRGETTILVTSMEETATAIVEVKTLINFLPEPYLGFGENYETVKSKAAAGEEIIEIENGFGIQKRIDHSDVIYGYMFENNKLNLSMFACETLSNIASVIVDFLLERYIPVAQTGAYSAGFISPEKDKIILFSTSDDLRMIYVSYMEYDGNTETAVRSTKLFDEQIKRFVNDTLSNSLK